MILQPYLSIGTYDDRDRYLICSDGLTDTVLTEEIKEILQEPDPGKTAMRLINKALHNGGTDNVTVIVCDIRRTCLLRSLWC